MAKEKGISANGVVIDCLPGLDFKVRLDSGQEILVYLSGKMSKNHIRILLGDKVTIEMSPYDMSRGRIIYRYK